MLRIHQSSSVEAAKSYYTAELSCASLGDYYGLGNSAAVWGGKSAVILGLSGEVNKDDFHILCDNRRPDTGEKLNPRDNATRKVGYDFTFNAPKSVSLVLSVILDDRILKVFQQAVRDTMSYIEAEAHVRVRKGGVVGVRKTGNLLWSEFTHFETRPGDDGITAPQLHCHAYVQNTSYDFFEQKFKAGDFFPIVKSAVYYEAIFHSRLAQGIKELGYVIENKPFSFEIAGIGDGNLHRFSRRTQEIEAMAKKLGISGNAEAMSKLGALTRKGKKTAKLEGANKISEWRERLDWSELELGRVQQMQPTVSASQAVALAIDSSFERRSVFPLRRIVADAMQLSLGDCSFEEIVGEIRRNDDLIVTSINEVCYATTKEVLAEEKAILAFLKETKSSCIPMLAWYREKSQTLDDEQKAAVEGIIRTRDRVICVAGRAGSGKTTMMKTAVAAMESVGERVFTFAPTSQAAHQVLKNEGFQNSETVQQLLVNTKLQDEIQGRILWIDESGLLSTKELNQIIEIAKKQNARLILSGDYKQHSSVGRGDAFRLVCESKLATVLETRSIYRQRNESYKKAVTALSIGDAVEALTILDDMGAIKEVADFEESLKLEAIEYVDSLNQYKTVLAVSPTHLEGRLLTSEIRSAMRNRGKLGDAETTLPVYRSRNLTESQRKLTPFYSLGDVVRFHQNAKGGFKKSDIARVVAKNNEGVFVQKMGEVEMLHIDFETAQHFGVFSESCISVSVGDRMRVTRNAVTEDGKKLYNGNVYQITEIEDSGNIILDGKHRIAPESWLLDYGYVSTSHASQGKTASKVIISQSSLSFDAASLEQFYVSVSRGRDAITIYTDSVADLVDSVRDPTERMLAVELEDRQMHMEEESQSMSADQHSEQLGR